MSDFNLGNAPEGSVVKGVKADGTIICIAPEEAYYNYRLSLEDIFTVEDCEDVLASMHLLGIISCDDAMEVMNYGSANCSTFTKDDVLEIRKSLEG